MPRIPESELERLKTEIPVADLARESGVELRAHGADLVGLCPFHEDREPSLVVTPGKNLWHCLGACQAGGSPIDWIMRAEGVSCGTGHTQPLYKNPLFLDAEHAFGRTGFPVRTHARPIDYSQARCPETERIYTTEAVHLSHAQFLGPQSDMDLILAAIEKIWTNREALRK